MLKQIFLVAVIALAVGRTPAQPASAPTPEPRELPIFVAAESATPLWPTYGPPTPAPTPTPTPAFAPLPTAPGVMAASSSMIPWYVPESHHAAYMQCLDDPQRFNRTDWIATKDWPVEEATYIADHEGGWDLCQFNTTGSGACGWFQLLRCPPDGLMPEAQIAGAYAKYLDGARNYPERSGFWQHWYQWWSN